MKAEHIRIKPHSGYLEMDVPLNTRRNFNKYQALKWGDAVRTAREQRQQDQPPTYGMAAGLAAGLPRGARRPVVIKDAADRELDIQNDITTFDDAVNSSKVITKQTLGGQIIQHTTEVENGKPAYFVGAFRGKELHLSRVAGTAMMRPQFPHLDAEDQRARLSGSHAYTATAAHAADVVDGQAGSSKAPVEKARVVHQTYKNSGGPSNPRGELEEQTNAMRQALQNAAEEDWTALDLMDDEDDDAYLKWDQKMFVQETHRAAKLQSKMDSAEFLDAISGRTQTKTAAKGEQKKAESPTRVRKRGKGSRGDEG
jgi:DNA-directed RNA polymerase III subunit RPC5